MIKRQVAETRNSDLDGIWFLHTLCRGPLLNSVRLQRGALGGSGSGSGAVAVVSVVLVVVAVAVVVVVVVVG